MFINRENFVALHLDLGRIGWDMQDSQIESQKKYANEIWDMCGEDGTRVNLFQNYMNAYISIVRKKTLEIV